MNKIKNKLRSVLSDYTDILKLEVKSSGNNRKCFEITGDMDDKQEDEIISNFKEIVSNIGGPDGKYEIIQDTWRPSKDGKTLVLTVEDLNVRVGDEKIKDVIRATLYLAIYGTIYFANKFFLKWYYVPRK